MSTRQQRGRHRAARPRLVPVRTTRPVRRRHLRPHRRGPLVVLAATVLLVSAGSGAAVAAWVSSGQGPAAGRATVAKDVVIAAATPTAELYPGGTASVRLTVSNPNAYAVQLTKASFGAITISPVSGRSCSSGVEAVSAGPVTLGTPVDLPAGSGPVTVTLTNAVKMLTTADNGCQDASFSVVVTLTGTST